MTISRHTHAAEVAMFQMFSYFAKDVIEVSRIVVYVNCIIGELELIAVKKKPKSRQVLKVNSAEQQEQY
jgi:hypothetical protein